MLETIMLLIEEMQTEKRHMPPTTFYNEGWLLRLIMHWFSQNQIAGHLLSFRSGAEWYSEGLLSSQFLPVYKGDRLAESYTHADGIIGNIAVGERGKGDIFLKEPFEQFLVIEAKLFSKFSRGATNAPGYNQAARNIACMASLVERSSCSFKGFSSLGFYLLAPAVQIKIEPSFTQFMEKESVYHKVHSRVESYKGRSDYHEKRRWFVEYFEPLLRKADLQTISWEEIIKSINEHDSVMCKNIMRFYNLCLEFNRSK